MWGVSLGGYYAPRVASGDGRVRACVALAGPYTFADGWDSRPMLTQEAFRVRSKSPDMAAARAAAAELSMESRAELIRCPLLAVTGKRDRLIAWEDSARLVKEASGPAELLLLEEGNQAALTWRLTIATGRQTGWRSSCPLRAGRPPPRVLEHGP